MSSDSDEFYSDDDYSDALEQLMADPNANANAQQQAGNVPLAIAGPPQPPAGNVAPAPVAQPIIEPQPNGAQMEFPRNRVPDDAVQDPVIDDTQPFPGTNINPVQYNRALIESRRFFEEWLKPNMLFRGLMCRNVHLPPINANRIDNPEVPTMVAVFVRGRLYMEDPAKPRGPNQILMGVMAELAWPALPDDLFLEELAAQAYLVEVVQHIIRTAELREEFYDHPGNFDRLVGPEMAALWANPDGMTPRQAMDYLYYFAVHTRVHLTGTTLIAHMFCGIMKRGTMSLRFIQKVETAIQDELHQRVTLHAEVMATVHSAFAQYMSSQVARTLVHYWHMITPAQALRLRLVVQQAANSGLTALIVTGKAFATYSGFKWSAIKRIFPEQWDFFQEAVNIVNGDVYYGFNPNLQRIRSTGYKEFAWVAKELLIRVGGQGTLAQYRGWVMVPREQNTLEKLLTEYIGKRTAYLSDPGGENPEPKDEDIDDDMRALRRKIATQTDLYQG